MGVIKRGSILGCYWLRVHVGQTYTHLENQETSCHDVEILTDAKKGVTGKETEAQCGVAS